MTNDLQFEFMGFNSDEKIKNFVSRLAETLHCSTHSDSAMKLMIEKSKNVVRASCRIVSQAGTFVGDSISENPVKAMQQIEQKLRKELDDWNVRRFEKPAHKSKTIQDAI